MSDLNRILHLIANNENDVCAEGRSLKLNQDEEMVEIPSRTLFNPPIECTKDDTIVIIISCSERGDCDITSVKKETMICIV